MSVALNAVLQLALPIFPLTGHVRGLGPLIFFVELVHEVLVKIQSLLVAESLTATIALDRGIHNYTNILKSSAHHHLNQSQYRARAT